MDDPKITLIQFSKFYQSIFCSDRYLMAIEVVISKLKNSLTFFVNQSKISVITRLFGKLGYVKKSLGMKI